MDSTALSSNSLFLCVHFERVYYSADTRVWSWGWGVHGQLGLRSVDDRATPTHSSLLDNKQVSFIAAGYGHSAILTAEVGNKILPVNVKDIIIVCRPFAGQGVYVWKW